jgi:dTDP-4-dehydrorhamnose 3,5-epimerase
MLFSGNFKSDFRGKVYFNNNISLSKIKRFYIVQNQKKNFIRAWHGHLKEEKYIFCVQGKAKIGAVKISNSTKPSKKNKPLFWKLDSSKPDIIFIPAGYANASKSLDKKMKLVIFSNLTLAQSIKDDYRYTEDYWKFL